MMKIPFSFSRRLKTLSKKIKGKNQRIKVFELNGNYTYDVGNPTPIPTNINTAFTFNSVSHT